MSHLFRSPAPLRRLRGAAFMIAALVSAACSAESGGSGGWSTGPGAGTEQPAGSIVGVYRLATVNGDPLTMPWESDGAFANYFSSGEIELKADGTFERTIRGRTVIPQMDDTLYNEHWSGTYAFQPSAPGEDNGEITLHNNAGGTDELDITQISITDVNTTCRA